MVPTAALLRHLGYPAAACATLQRWPRCEYFRATDSLALLEALVAAGRAGCRGGPALCCRAARRCALTTALPLTTAGETEPASRPGAQRAATVLVLGMAKMLRQASPHEMRQASRGGSALLVEGPAVGSARPACGAPLSMLQMRRCPSSPFQALRDGFVRQPQRLLVALHGVGGAGGRLALQEAAAALELAYAGVVYLADSYDTSLHNLLSGCIAVLQALPPAAVAGARGSGWSGGWGRLPDATSARSPVSSFLSAGSPPLLKLVGTALADYSAAIGPSPGTQACVACLGLLARCCCRCSSPPCSAQLAAAAVPPANWSKDLFVDGLCGCDTCASIQAWRGRYRLLRQVSKHAAEPPPCLPTCPPAPPAASTLPQAFVAAPDQMELALPAGPCARRVWK